MTQREIRDKVLWRTVTDPNYLKELIEGYKNKVPVDSKDNGIEGRKDDSDKIEMALLDPGFLEGIAKVLTYGSRKYARYNWAKGISYHRVYSAMQRHLNAFWKGEENDPETGLSHLYHASCNAMFLCAFEANKDKYKEFDDRWQEEKVL